MGVPPRSVSHLSNKIHHNKVKNDVCEDKVGEGAFLGDEAELRLVFRINLHTEAG